MIAKELIETGHAAHPLMGVSLADATDSKGNDLARVQAVSSGGPADKAGIEVGDVITAVGSQQTAYVYLGDHWYGNQDTTAPGKHNDRATYVFQPIVFSGTKIGLPTYQVRWKLDVGAGTWPP